MEQRGAEGAQCSSSSPELPCWTSPTLPPAMQRSCGWGVEQFRLREQLHKGSGSRVHAALDLLSNTLVALKMYPKRKLSPLARFQVQREISLHLQLEHENIIKLYAAFEDEQGVYLVQELARGGDLFHKIKSWGQEHPDESRIVHDFMVPFLNALKYIHAKGIIHRDIKPENIILTADGVLKLADFGLAINMNEERPVTRAGTLQYMAPEVLVCPEKTMPEENKDRKELAYTAQVDSWAAGILAYELMLGHPPFGKESNQISPEYVMNVIDKQPELPFWMSKDVKAFIKAALCKDPGTRPTAKQLLKQPWIRQHCSARRNSSLSGRSADGTPPPPPLPPRLGAPTSPESLRSPDTAAAAAAGAGRYPKSGVLSDDSLFSTLVGRALSYAAAPSLHSAGPVSSPSSLTRNHSMPFEASPSRSSPPLSSTDSCRKDPEHLLTSSPVQRAIPSGRRKLSSLIKKVVRGAAAAHAPRSEELPSAARDRDWREEPNGGGSGGGRILSPAQLQQQDSSARRRSVMIPSARPPPSSSGGSTRALSSHSWAQEAGAAAAGASAGAGALQRSHRTSSEHIPAAPAKQALLLGRSPSRPPPPTLSPFSAGGIRHTLFTPEGPRGLSSRREGAS